MASLNFLRRAVGDDRGAELIEFAFVLPLLLLLVGGIMDFGFVFLRYEVVTNAAREGARLATLAAAYDQADIQARVEDYLQASGVPTADAGGALVTTTLEAVTIPVGAGTASAARVTVQYTHQFFFLGVLSGLVGGSFSNITLDAASTMRTEVQAGA